jgi:hypothetical protein
LKENVERISPMTPSEKGKCKFASKTECDFCKLNDGVCIDPEDCPDYEEEEE